MSESSPHLYHKQIARFAYELVGKEGAACGLGERDWLLAEQILEFLDPGQTAPWSPYIRGQRVIE